MALPDSGNREKCATTLNKMKMNLLKTKEHEYFDGLSVAILVLGKSKTQGQIIAKIQHYLSFLTKRMCF